MASAKIFVRYYHYDVLRDKSNPVDDCFATSIPMFRDAIIKYPGVAGAIGYGRNIRPDLQATILLEYDGGKVKVNKEFNNVFELADFLDHFPEIAKTLQYVKKR